MDVGLESLIREAFRGSAADLFLLVGSPPAVREEGVVRPLLAWEIENLGGLPGGARQ